MIFEPAIHLSSNWREHEKMLAKQEKREVYGRHFVSRLANHFSHLAFRCSRQAIGILMKHQRRRDDTHDIFVHHYTFIKLLYSFAYFPHQIFFVFPLTWSSWIFFPTAQKCARNFVYRDFVCFERHTQHRVGRTAQRSRQLPRVADILGQQIVSGEKRRKREGKSEMACLHSMLLHLTPCISYLY